MQCTSCSLQTWCHGQGEQQNDAPYISKILLVYVSRMFLLGRCRARFCTNDKGVQHSLQHHLRTTFFSFDGHVLIQGKYRHTSNAQRIAATKADSGSPANKDSASAALSPST